MRDPFGPAWESFCATRFDDFRAKELPNIPQTDERLQRLRRGKTALRTRPSLRCQLIGAAIATGLAIVLSIAAIPFVPMLACSTALPVIVLLLAGGLTLVSLWFYAQVVLATIQGSGAPTPWTRAGRRPEPNDRE